MKVSRMLTALLMAAASVAQADVVLHSTTLAPEAAGATGSGSVLLTLNTTDRTLGIDADWAGLSAGTTVAHIHCCTAAAGTGTVGVAVTPTTLPGFPTGVTSGSYAVLLDLTSSATYTSGFVTNFGGGTLGGAESALIDGLNDGTAYFNIHTNAFPAGEIRGFLAAVPEPGTYSLMLLGLAAVAVTKRLRSKST